MQSAKDHLAATARDALNTLKWCEENPNDAERLNLARSEFEKHAQEYSTFILTEMKQNTIADLREQLTALDQDYALADSTLTRAEYYARKKAITQQIQIIDTRPNCTYSADPTPEQSALKALKWEAWRNIETCRGRVSSKDLNEVQIRLTHATDEKEVHGYYATWQQKLAFKHIAQLPDLNPIKNAA